MGEAEEEKSLEFKASLGLQNEFQDSQGYSEKPCFEKLKGQEGIAKKQPFDLDWVTAKLGVQEDE